MGKKIDVLENNHKIFEQLTKVGAVTDGTKQAGMSEGVLADGGALVPIAFPAMIIEFATQQSPILSRVWRFPMTTNVMRIPRLQQAAGSYFGGITLYSPDEGELKQDTKPTLQRIEFNAKKLIGLIYLTDELIADSAINIINYVTALTLRAFQYNLEYRVINGTGVGPMMGILNAAGITTVARAGAGAISYNDVINLDSVIDENIQNLVWMTRKASQNTLMRLVDLNNRPIFMADYAVFAGQPAHPNTMISYPVYRTRNVPTLGTNGDLILGDLSWYMLAIRQDMTVDMSEHVRFVYDEQTLRFVMRLDGQPVVPAAFTYLVGTAGS
jgi:HK97 family phage major capsid protein